MNLTIEIPDDRAARFRKIAQDRGLTVDRWMLDIAEHEAAANVTREPTLFAKVRGLGDDVDFRRDDPSPGRNIDL
jgi:hypothetical protein